MHASNSGAVISAIGRPPIQGNISISSRRMILFEWVAAHPGENLPCHSRAITSKLFEARIAPAALIAFLFSPGSMPPASSLRASSRRSRAFNKVMSGYVPNANVFCFPAKRYASRQYFAPLGCTSRNSPPPSDSFVGLSVAFALYTRIAVNGIVGPSVGIAAYQQ